MPRLARLALVVFILLVPALQAQPAHLVKDLTLGPVNPDWPIDTEWVAFGNLAVFTTYDSIHGDEIWKTDGTAAGTSVIADVCPGICSSRADSLAVVGGAVFFHADDGVHGPALWKTDGTAAGTVLVRTGVRPFHAIAFGSLVLFLRYSTDGDGQLELWRSDGTSDGTFLLHELGDQGGSDPWLGYAGNLLLFSNWDELWKTDGTVAGTSLVLSSSGGDPRPASGGLYPSIGGRLFFLWGSQPWISDGTPAGTHQIANVFVGGDYDGLSSRIAALGNEVFFSGHDSQGFELWKSDGTAAGTVRVKDLNPTASSDPREFTTVGNHIFFRTSTPSRLWKSDGTAAGTVPVEPGPALGFLEVYNGFQAFAGKLVFFAFTDGIGEEPWVSDGTAAGTMLLKDLYPGNASSFNDRPWVDPYSGQPVSRLDGGAIAGGTWLFRAETASGGTVWKSDGTPAGTALVQAIHDGTGRSGLDPFFDPATPSLADLGGTLLFSGDADGDPANLWRTDGSEPATVRIDGFALAPAALTRFGNHVYFGSRDASRLWRTDGATVEDIDAAGGFWKWNLVAAGPNLFYLTDGAQQIRRTNGTTVAQVFSTPEEWSLGDLTAAGTNLFFAKRTMSGKELWKSAGAPNDAVRVAAFPYLWPRQLGPFAGLGSSLLFAANDGTTGRELWVSDGTAAGTHMLKDIVPGAGSSDPRALVAAGSLVFFVADDGVDGAELWRSDGTAAGTVRVKDIRPGAESSWIAGLTAWGNLVVFAADDGVDGLELWRSDGTEDGTLLVEDIRPGAASSYPGAFRVTGPFVLFAADDGTHGLEPWRTDGTAARTFLVQDVNPGRKPSSPAGFTLSGNRVFFVATDGAHGFELWSADLAALGPVVISDRPLDFHAIPPCRVLDTRASAALAAGVPRSFPVAGTCGIPATARAVAANLTVVGSTGAGYVVAYPAGIPVPGTASITFSAGQVRSNNLQLGLLAGQADARASVPVHLILDVSGYYE